MVFPVYDQWPYQVGNHVRNLRRSSESGRAEGMTPSRKTSSPYPKSSSLGSHSGRVIRAFAPLRHVLLVLGRFPFVPTVRKGENDPSGLTGLNYSSSIFSISWLYFGITSLALASLLLLFVGSFLAGVLSWTFFGFPRWTDEQKSLFEHNLIPFVLVWSCLLTATVGNMSFFWNRKAFVKLLNFSSVAVDTMEIELPNGLPKFLYVSNLWFLGFACAAVISSEVLGIKLANGGATLLGVLVIRIFNPHITAAEWERSWGCRVLGLVIILYSMYASRSMLFFFVFQCKLLQICIRIWNKRLKQELAQVGKNSLDELAIEEVNCKRLFHHHIINLKMVRLMSKVYAAILMSYFGSQVLNMCFELYYCAMSNTLTLFNTDADEKDTFVAILVLVQNVYVFLSVSLHGAYVGEEANRGFEIIKTTGISPSDSVAKRHFLLNLQATYAHRICLHGGHYFLLDKPFAVTVLSAVFTYFIIILQYGQYFGFNNNPN